MEIDGINRVREEGESERDLEGEVKGIELISLSLHSLQVSRL